MTAGLDPLMVILRFLFFPLLLGIEVTSFKPTSLAIALAVSLLKIGDMMGLKELPEEMEVPFLPAGDSGGLTELLSREELPKSLSWALRALLGRLPSS